MYEAYKLHLLDLGRENIMQNRGNLYVASAGRVICLRKSDGKELWRTKLPKLFKDITTILVEDETIFAATQGELFALNPKTGNVDWQMPLKAGAGVCILGSDAPSA